MDPGCVEGDFNIVLLSSDRNRGEWFTVARRRFLDIKESLTYVISTFVGGGVCGLPLTWCGRMNNNQSKSRLDQFLVSEGWESYFSGIMQSTLPRPMSDQSPILLDGRWIRGGNIPFKYENMWLKVDEFKDLINSWWWGYHFRGLCNFVLTSKLKALNWIWSSRMKRFSAIVVLRKEMAFN